MRQYKIELTDLAEIDLEDIGDYISFILKNPTAAYNTIKGIKEKVKHAPEHSRILCCSGVIISCIITVT